METSKLIETLRFCGDKESDCTACGRYDDMGVDGGTNACMCDLMQKAADTIEALQAELRDEMHRHDRPQDFEVAEAQYLGGLEEKIADHLIANGVTVQEWISVDDRLPENDVMVIGYTPCDGFMFVGYYHEEPKYDWKVWRIVTAMRSTKVMKKKVTHWLPFPKPPKGE